MYFTQDRFLTVGLLGRRVNISSFLTGDPQKWGRVKKSQRQHLRVSLSNPDDASLPEAVKEAFSIGLVPKAEEAIGWEGLTLSSICAMWEIMGVLKSRVQGNATCFCCPIPWLVVLWLLAEALELVPGPSREDSSCPCLSDLPGQSAAGSGKRAGASQGLDQQALEAWLASKPHAP